MAAVKETSRETVQSTQIERIMKALKTFRRTFIEKASAKGRCILPERLVNIFGPAWSGYGNIEIRYSGSFIHSTDPYECVFEKSDGSWVGQNLNDIVTLEDYEQLLFSCWSYADGQALDINEPDDLCFMNWSVKQDAAEVLEKIVKDIEVLLVPLNRNSNFEEYVKKIPQILRNGNSEWTYSRVPWTYLKDLDEAIKEFEYICEQNLDFEELDSIFDSLPQAIPYNL